jgi:hypothetical protein
MLKLAKDRSGYFTILMCAAGQLNNYEEERKVKVVFDNLANFLSISPNQT